MPTSYETLVAVARTSERLGFGAFFRSDHYLSMGGDGLPGPTDAWTTLAGIARETSTIRLWTLMTSATFRHPGGSVASTRPTASRSPARSSASTGSRSSSP